MKTKRSIIAPPEVNRRAQRNRTILYITLALVVLIIVAVVAFYSRVPKTASVAPTQSNIKVGDVAPQFDVATTNGPFDLKQAQAAGKPVFLEVFATWCPHCQHEVPVIGQLYKQYGSRMDFLGVSGSPYGMDGSSPESQNDVINFQQSFHVEYPIAYDPTMGVATKYLLGGYPTIVIIDKSGKVSYLNSGEIDAKDLSKQIQKAIGT
jgi:cytochrome c biogenesis protein CcmG, thiol:disulfide interchange protein DsbE